MTTPGIGHNQPPAPTPFELIEANINDLYEEARNWADGEPIADQATHDEIDRLHGMLHEAGQLADNNRVIENTPFDNGKAEVQARYAPLIGNTTKVKGKVPLGKEALSALMLPWRRKVQEEKVAVAREAQAEAERLAAIAREAMATSAGNLEAREDAELLVKEAAAVGRFAKAATKGPTGLRSVWKAEMVDEGAALDWAYGRDPEAFRALCQSQADSQVRAGMRTVPGFGVYETKVAM